MLFIIALVLLSFASFAECKVQLKLKDPQTTQLIQWYGEYLKLRLENPVLDKQEMLSRLTKLGFSCTLDDIEKLEQETTALTTIIKNQVTNGAQSIAQLFIREQMQQFHVIENLCMQGMSPQEIHNELKTRYDSKSMSLERVNFICENAERKKRVLFEHLPNQLCINQIHQMIVRSKNSSELTEEYRRITQKTGNPAEQLKMLEKYEAQLTLKEFNIIDPTAPLEGSYFGKFPEKLLKFIDHQKNAEHYPTSVQEEKQGLLFMGHPGTGKTYTARFLAQELGAGFLMINGSDILEGIVGESEKKLNRLMEAAENYSKLYGRRCVVFLDEVDSVGRKRGERGTENLQTITNKLLTLVTYINQKPNLIAIAATNSTRDELDSALARSGRFGEEIKFELPTTSERLEHLTQLLAKHLPNSHELEINLEELVQLTADKFSPADLKKVIIEGIKQASFQRRAPIMDDFLKEIDTIQQIKEVEEKQRIKKKKQKF